MLFSTIWLLEQFTECPLSGPQVMALMQIHLASLYITEEA